MVGRGNRNRINLVVQFGKHFAIVLKGGGTFKLFGPGVHFAVGVIDITKSDHFHITMLCKIHGINAALSACPDMGGTDLTVG